MGLLQDKYKQDVRKDLMFEPFSRQPSTFPEYTGGNNIRLRLPSVNLREYITRNLDVKLNVARSKKKITV
jgi:hypothetical protein